MPNWCSNSVAFYSNENGSNALLMAFYADVQKYVNYIEPDTGRRSDWCGHWLESNKIDTSNMFCRGTFESCELYPDHVIIHMEAAWSPIEEVWDKMAEKYDLNYVFISEEPGCEVYINSDVEGRFFSTRFILNYFELDYLKLDSETLIKYGERLKELSGETRYYSGFDELLDDCGRHDGNCIRSVENQGNCY